MSIEVIGVSFLYNKGLPNEHKALDNITLTIPESSIVAVVGHTGSGKSTLMQLLNGLLKPSDGKVLLENKNINSSEVNIQSVRQQVGLVFQYPEYQLFEETVFKDVAYGPKNLGLSEEEVTNRVIEALKMVGIEGEQYLKASPFNLSGGEKRRVALAGVLAMQPKYLILDEPTAGLDPQGRNQIMRAIIRLQKKSGITVVIVTHAMEEVARYAKLVYVLQSGKLILSGPPLEIFANIDTLKVAGLDLPEATAVVNSLKKRGYNLPLALDTTEVAEVIANAWGKQNAK